MTAFDTIVRGGTVVNAVDSVACDIGIGTFQVFSSDPGLLSARETTQKPVFGIGAASYAAALLLGEKFGVIAILSDAPVWRGIARRSSTPSVCR
jgi:hypothetical protein